MKNENIQEGLMLASIFLQYPDEMFANSMEELQTEANKLGDESIITSFHNFIDQTSNTSLEELCQNYVYTFDFGRGTNLYVTYAEHGEQRGRGAVLANIKKKYEAAGFEMKNNGELPDYLPLMLEFASVSSFEAGTDLLKEYESQIIAIHKQLLEMNSPYQFVLQAILTILEMVPVPETPKEAHSHG
ncbi:nitrate reductase molybdenum cofactor assembly chaperone [Aquibacillus sp. 3ASR75-11]|uniref:Nitrate reductase molybdenum cofactor assembly chaperone n=1 Tax=Terrihalobacillus insolitus TaxID=2950438 RepID=A0A9X4AND6_9BACI|nr:nitrate reductase molybdenum cofactor assembly chaperone [Terrihalobacillus insolitus]MDC3413509.1 nitrate reductase molybdenum cofactor assembly chaperone [Terrihalobacillus insolitus]MDC3426311.1 nitrate reductase molybdenum cofactor assembly chaperone [Terrihalobacillus insolitus]